MPQTIPDWLAHRARTHPDHPALVAEGETVSYTGLERRVAAVAGKLRRLGVTQGGRVVLLCGNRIEFAVTLHALRRLGAASVPLGQRLTPEELSAQVADCGPGLLVYEAAQEAAALEVGRRLGVPGVRLDPDGSGCDPLIHELPGEPLQAPAIDLETVHTILYTSGSGGKPKGILLTCGNHFWSAVGSALRLGANPDDRWLACLPFSHVGGLSILLRSTIYGTAAVIQNGFDPEKANRALEEECVTAVSVVANMLERMIEARGGRRFPPWLRFMLLGGGPAPAPLIESCATKGVPVAPTYGLTETASQVATLRPDEAARRPGASGRPLLTAELRIEGQDGSALAGSDGEILVRGPTVSPGFAGAGDPSERTDGWLRTGDLGRLDTDGFLYVAGRRDEMIISGGENIQPEEVEGALGTHPAVAEACVFGSADRRWGETVSAAIRLRRGMSASTKELRDHARSCLAGFKVPRRFYFVEELPRTASGKIARHRVRESARALPFSEDDKPHEFIGR